MTTSPQADLAALQMENVTIVAMNDQSVVVAEEVNWTVMTGDYWVIAGLQGAGKSDFLLLAAGLMPPAHGQYRLFGEQMPIFEDHRMAQRLRIGMVFESGRALGRLTVRENIALPLQYHRNSKESEVDGLVSQVLEATDLRPFADSLSGGLPPSWQKRVGLARALTLKPEVLLVDNPLGGMDPRHAAWWLGFLDELSRGHELFDKRPVTLVLTAAELLSWKNRARQFAQLSGRRLRVLGSWAQLETAREELLREMLTGQTLTG